jgi:hypothetical protein
VQIATNILQRYERRQRIDGCSFYFSSIFSKFGLDKLQAKSGINGAFIGRLTAKCLKSYWNTLLFRE